MKLGKFFILILCMFGLFSGHAFSKQQASVIEGRMYINADQLIISNHGIHILLEDVNGLLSKVSVSQINSDETGLFILAEHIPTPQAAWCRMGHKACNDCGRCSFPGCPTRPCRC